MVELHLIGEGEVQGVFFRATARDLASGMGLTGFVKNLPNGKVELIAQGEKKALEELVNALKKHFNAEFTITYSTPQKVYSEFLIAR